MCYYKILELLSEYESSVIQNEGFVNKNNVIYFDQNSDDFLNTRFGKGKFIPYQSKLPKSNAVVYSVYKKDSAEILKIFKSSHDDISIDDEELKKFLNRTSVYVNRLIKDKNIDTIIKLPSSSSIGNDFIGLIINKMSHSNVVVYLDKIVKNMKNVKVSTTSKLPNNIRDKISKMILSDDFQIKKLPPKYRKFVEGFMEIDASVFRNIFNKDILVIDDYITSGISMDDVCVCLLKMNPKSITGLTIVK